MSMPIESVGPQATLPAGYDPSRATVNASGSGKKTEMFDSKMFLQLLVAQLKYQDPTNPVDTSNFMNQTAMLSQVETMNSMSATLTEMVTAQQTASATSMIGKAISFLDPAGNQVSGIVDAVSIHKGSAMLHVGDLAVPLSGVIAVANPIPIADGGVDPSQTGSDNAAIDGVGGVGDAGAAGDGVGGVGDAGAAGVGVGDAGAVGGAGAGATDGAADPGGAGASGTSSGAGDPGVTSPDDGHTTSGTGTGTGAAADPTTSPASTIRPDTISA